MYEDFIYKKGFKHWIRGVVHSQIKCTDVKSQICGQSTHRPRSAVNPFSLPVLLCIFLVKYYHRHGRIDDHLSIIYGLIKQKIISQWPTHSVCWQVVVHLLLAATTWPCANVLARRHHNPSAITCRHPLLDAGWWFSSFFRGLLTAKNHTKKSPRKW